MGLQAAAFVNYTIPIGLGHVGWGFEKSPGQWYWGALEMAGMIKAKDGDNATQKWAFGNGNGTFNYLGSAGEMITSMRTAQQRPNEPRGGYAYHDYKLIQVPRPNIGAALQVVERVRAGGYGLVGNNCLNAVYDVIKAYSGDGNIVPWPLTNPIPRLWFSAIKSKAIFIQSEAATGNWLSQHGAAA